MGAHGHNQARPCTQNGQSIGTAMRMPDASKTFKQVVQTQKIQTKNACFYLKVLLLSELLHHTSKIVKK